MDDLIEALTILSKYLDKKGCRLPTRCEHDVLLIDPVVNTDNVSLEDQKRLEDLGFVFMEEYDSFGSYRFG